MAAEENSMANIDVPVACSLTTAELQQRREDVLRGIRNAVLEVREHAEGFAYRFLSDDQLLDQLAEMIKLERRCCPFLRFDLRIEPGDGPVWLELSGPDGTKQFLASLFDG
ncbi:MAG: hypothetical protein ACJ8LM_17030 [Candidatus Udaeobacter sp.]